jgi:hypothetical protein
LKAEGEVEGDVFLEPGDCERPFFFLLGACRLTAVVVVVVVVEVVVEGAGVLGLVCVGLALGLTASITGKLKEASPCVVLAVVLAVVVSVLVVEVVVVVLVAVAPRSNLKVGPNNQYSETTQIE